MKKKDNSITALKLDIEKIDKDIKKAIAEGKPFFASRLTIIKNRKIKKLESWVRYA